MDHWTPERDKIYNWIANDLLLPVFAEAYKGAVNSLFLQTPGHVTFVSHAGRDIMNIMAREYSGGTAGRVQYKELTEQIEEVWKLEEIDAPSLESGLSETDLKPVSIARKAYDAVNKLLNEHKAGGLRSNDLPYLFFSVFLDYTDTRRILERDLKEWKVTKKWFMDHAHLRRRPFSTDSSDDCKKHFLVLEQMLLTAADSVRARLIALDEILRATN